MAVSVKVSVKWGRGAADGFKAAGFGEVYIGGEDIVAVQVVSYVQKVFDGGYTCRRAYCERG
jgi:hypothetical protein